MILVTGANGFIGHAVVRTLRERLMPVRGAVRRDMIPGDVKIGSINSTTDWLEALRGVETVIHTAGMAHRSPAGDAQAEAIYRSVNLDGTLRLAEQSVMAGVRRFIFISSINAADDQARDQYGRFKREAEQLLRPLGARMGLEVIIIRPPLVYGPGVKANFLALLDWIYRRIPLPLGTITNSRSLIALDNLVDFILRCAVYPAAIDETFAVSDGEDISTSDLITRLGQYLGRPARLFYVPPGLLRIALGMLGRAEIADRLLGSTRIDIEPLRRKLGWTPPVLMDDGLKTVARWYLAERDRMRLRQATRLG